MFLGQLETRAPPHQHSTVLLEPLDSAYNDLFKLATNWTSTIDLSQLDNPITEVQLILGCALRNYKHNPKITQKVIQAAKALQRTAQGAATGNGFGIFAGIVKLLLELQDLHDLLAVRPNNESIFIVTNILSLSLCFLLGIQSLL